MKSAVSVDGGPAAEGREEPRGLAAHRVAQRGSNVGNAMALTSAAEIAKLEYWPTKSVVSAWAFAS